MSAEQVGKLRLVEAPHRRHACEENMRYDLVLDGERVGEVFFNTCGYVICRDTGKLPGILTGEEMSLTAIKREVAHWNKQNKEKAWAS